MFPKNNAYKASGMEVEGRNNTMWRRNGKSAEGRKKNGGRCAVFHFSLEFRQNEESDVSGVRTLSLLFRRLNFSCH